MSNSPLVDFARISPNCTSPRNHVIDTITIHCVVGQCSAEALGEHFANRATNASSNYGVDKDGRIGLYVDEGDKSWCSSNDENDHRAVTIEVACDPQHPYAVNDAAYSALIDLLVDICKRNNIAELKWRADKNLVGQVEKQNMTAHRWFAAKSCPGDWLYERHGEIAEAVNARLKDGAPWSAEAREWAVSTGLIVGHGDGNFGWGEPLTREQFVTILKRYDDINKGE